MPMPRLRTWTGFTLALPLLAQFASTIRRHFAVVTKSFAHPLALFRTQLTESLDRFSHLLALGRREPLPLALVLCLLLVGRRLLCRPQSPRWRRDQQRNQKTWCEFARLHRGIPHGAALAELDCVASHS